MKQLVIVGVLLVAATIGAFVAVVVRGDDSGERRTGSVTVLGDSLNVGIEPYLAAELEGWEIGHHNREGRRGDEGLDELRRLGSTVAPVLVVSLGTNDPQDDVEAFRRLVDDVVRLAGRGRCVVWSTIWLDGANGAFNEALREAAGRHGSLEIADWASLVEDEPGALSADRVHGSPEGYASKAEQVARIVERCHPRRETGS